MKYGQVGRGALRVGVGVAVLALLSQVLGGAGPSVPSGRTGAEAQHGQWYDLMRESTSAANLRQYEEGLEMKDDTDFLLAPAILVQEAISEEVVMTYPAE